MMSLHNLMDSSQINTWGPATSDFTSCWFLPQKKTIEHRSALRWTWRLDSRAGRWLCRIDFGGQDIPVLVAERFRDQLQDSANGVITIALAFKASRRECAMNSRIAEIAHAGAPLYIDERKRSVPALPTCSPMARARV